MTKKLVRAALSLLIAALLLAGCRSIAPASPPEFARGVWNEDTYTSAYAELSFALPEEWKAAPDAELANDMRIRISEMAGAGMLFTEQMLALDELTDMRAASSYSDSFVLVGYATLANIKGGTEFTEEDYLEYEKEQMEDISSVIGFVYGDYYRVKTIGGNKYTVLEAEFEGYGVSIFYAVRRIGDYMLVVAITAAGDDSIDDILSHFS